MDQQVTLGIYSIGSSARQILREHFRRKNIVIKKIKDIDTLYSADYDCDYCPEVLLVDFGNMKEVEVDNLFNVMNSRKIIVMNLGNDSEPFRSDSFQLLYDCKENIEISNNIIVTMSKSVKKIKDLALKNGVSDPYKIANEVLKSLSKDQYTELVIFLMSLIETKDSYTKTHCQRTAMYAHYLADFLNLSEKNKLTISEIGLIHDVGKIGIPGKILRKNGALTSEEFEIIKKHSNIATNLLPTKYFGNMKHIVKSHHERYDGKGYPDGLCGNDIPYISRIISVADSFDAMTSNRHYNRVKTLKEAREEIMKCSGTQFDPQIAEAFVDMINQSDELNDYFDSQRVIVKTKR